MFKYSQNHSTHYATKCLSYCLMSTSQGISNSCYRETLLQCLSRAYTRPCALGPWSYRCSAVPHSDSIAVHDCNAVWLVHGRPLVVHHLDAVGLVHDGSLVVHHLDAVWLVHDGLLTVHHNTAPWWRWWRWWGWCLGRMVRVLPWVLGGVRRLGPERWWSA